MGSSKVLSLSEWAVLGLIAEGQTHGFAVSREFTADGSMGRIWTIPRPLVYRAIATLVAKEFVVEIGFAPGDAAPRRRLVEANDAGRAAVLQWLVQPVVHVRDVRSELLIKLMLLDRAGIDPTPLLVVQESLLEPMLLGLRSQLERSSGFESTVLSWRLHSTVALAHFLEDLKQVPRHQEE
jgi:PadR family transcriptional regulator AphA